jgi:hypothetical protein
MIVVIPTPFGLFADCKIEAKISVLLLYFIFNAFINTQSILICLVDVNSTSAT